MCIAFSWIRSNNAERASCLLAQDSPHHAWSPRVPLRRLPARLRKDASCRVRPSESCCPLAPFCTAPAMLTQAQRGLGPVPPEREPDRRILTQHISHRSPSGRSAALFEAGVFPNSTRVNWILSLPRVRTVALLLVCCHVPFSGVTGASVLSSIFQLHYQFFSFIVRVFFCPVPLIQVPVHGWATRKPAHPFRELRPSWHRAWGHTAPEPDIAQYQRCQHR